VRQAIGLSFFIFVRAGSLFAVKPFAGSLFPELGF
jgi:hypothetical protein